MSEPPDHILTFEVDEDNQLSIYGDKKGLRFLTESLERLLEQTEDGQLNHDHLMTADWSGKELSSESQVGEELIHHVKLICAK
jgi:hypothetical protein